MNRWRFMITLVGVYGVACAPGETTEDADRTSWQIVNGYWLVDTSFVSMTMFVDDEGKFTARESNRIDNTLDLRGMYVVPPFGDAHSHNLDGSYGIESTISAYLREGTFYIQSLGNTLGGADKVRDRFALVGTPDVTFAHGGLTSTLGAPVLHFEPRAMGLYDLSQWLTHRREICDSRQLEGDAYWYIASREDLHERWSSFLAGEPDLVKVYLLDSERYDRSWDCSQLGLRGLDPELLPEVVQLARASDLRVAVHVETAHDFEIAVEASVDLIAHLPGYRMARDEDPSRFQIDARIATLAGARGVSVTPTLRASMQLAGEDTVRLRQLLTLHRRNLRLLIESGVDVLVGGDIYGETVRSEVESLRSLGLWSDAELLNLWSRTTPRFIHPERELGTFQSGAEASFLVLRCNPLMDFGCVDDIRLWVKNGDSVDIRGPVQPPVPRAPGER